MKSIISPVVFLLGLASALVGRYISGRSRDKSKNLQDGTAMPMGEFQENLHLRKSVPLTYLFSAGFETNADLKI